MAEGRSWGGLITFPQNCRCLFVLFQKGAHSEDKINASHSLRPKWTCQCTWEIKKSVVSQTRQCQQNTKLSKWVRGPFLAFWCPSFYAPTHPCVSSSFDLYSKQPPLNCSSPLPSRFCLVSSSLSLHPSVLHPSLHLPSVPFGGVFIALLQHVRSVSPASAPRHTHTHTAVPFSTHPSRIWP